jgi:sulfite reductase (NADPH) flavoprotein alpha-component
MIIDRLHPFPAKIKERFLLTKSGSSKKTFHIVLGLEGSHIDFKVGDAIGIYPHNDPFLVQRMIQLLNADPETIIIHPRTQETLSLKTFLSEKVNLTRLNSGLIKLASSHNEKLQALLSDKPALLYYCHTHDTLEFLTEFKNRKFSLQDFCSQLSPLLPRFYSTASSPKHHPEEIHLTVALTSYEHKGEIRHGVASHFLCFLAEKMTTPIPSYIQPTPHFTLPQDPHASIIMVGPGTGVAPFRGFLQERLALNAPGKNWLFFGERNRHLDFFYEDFWQFLVSQKKLRLDLAFSRDQEEKIYVQHKLLEQGEDIWQWLQEGAFFYICGDADPMAKDVEAALVSIAEKYGHLNEHEARDYLKHLRAEKRLLVDVY